MFRLKWTFDPTVSFDRKESIKPWLVDQLAPWLIVVAIERSDNIKIVFRCKSGPVLCPFRVRANYSIRSKLWTLLVVSDLHNHKILNGERVAVLPSAQKKQKVHISNRTSDKSALDAIAQHTNVFVGIEKPPIEALAGEVDDIVSSMCSDVAQLMTRNIWQNPKLLSEQKEAAVSRIVAELVDEYLEESRPVAASLMPLSPLLNEPDFSDTQLPALSAPSRISGPLPPFNSLHTQLLPLPEGLDLAKTLNPVQLMKTHDLSEFKVDNIGAPPTLLLQFLAPNAPLPGDRDGLLGNLHLGYWSTVGLNE